LPVVVPCVCSSAVCPLFQYANFSTFRSLILAALFSQSSSYSLYFKHSDVPQGFSVLFGGSNKLNSPAPVLSPPASLPRTSGLFKCSKGIFLLVMDSGYFPSRPLQPCWLVLDVTFPSFLPPSLTCFANPNLAYEAIRFLPSLTPSLPHSPYKS
jgi:hypothetical protein